ncbi:hypothetical protein Tco_1492104 [Tanacetum coccineum]
MECGRMRSDRGLRAFVGLAAMAGWLDSLCCCFVNAWLTLCDYTMFSNLMYLLRPSLKGLFALWLDKLNKLAAVVDIFVFPVVCLFDDTYLRDYFKFIIGDEDTYAVVRSCQVSDSDQQKTDTTDTVHHFKARCEIKENVVESNLVQVMESVPTRVSTDRADMAVTITGAASLSLNAEPSPNNDTAAQIVCLPTRRSLYFESNDIYQTTTAVSMAVFGFRILAVPKSEMKARHTSDAYSAIIELTNNGTCLL